jgi:hypothetical protein
MPVETGHKARLDLSNNLFFDTCAYDPHFLAAAIRQRGVSQMVFGTEVPGTSSDIFNPALNRPVDDVLALLASFSFLLPAHLLDIVHHNPRRVFPRLANYL